MQRMCAACRTVGGRTRAILLSPGLLQHASTSLRMARPRVACKSLVRPMSWRRLVCADVCGNQEPGAGIWWGA